MAASDAMLMRVVPAALVFVVAAFAMLPRAADAQATRSGNDSARVMQQLQQLSADRDRLQGENEKLKRELEAARSGLETAQNQQEALNRKASSAESGLGAARRREEESAAALERTRGQLSELVARFRETAETLREVEGERAGLARQSADLSTRLDACMRRSVGLADIAEEALQLYEDKGVWAALAEKGSLTQLKRIEVENLVDDYREKIRDLEAAAALAPAQPPSPEP